MQFIDSPGHATVRFSTDDGLDGWDKQWVSREYHPLQKFAGYVTMTRDALLDAKSTTLMGLFNELEIVPVLNESPLWCDLGTYDNYMEYLER